MIYSFYHKDSFVPNSNIVIPLQLGKTLSKVELGFLSDDSGNSISHKNRKYCELTGMYWVWKNTDHEVLGFCHYRRFFIFESMIFKLNLKFIDIDQRIYGQIEKEDNLDRIKIILDKHDFIVPQPRRLKVSVKAYYILNHYLEDWEILGEILKKYNPDYLESYNQLSKTKEMYAFNMFITSREHFNNYMEWLFPILEKLEELLPKRNDVYQQRVIGFISERLFTIYLNKHAFKLKELPVLTVQEPSFRENLISRIFLS